MNMTTSTSSGLAGSRSLAWNTTVAALALEKLRQKKPISAKEKSTLEKVASEISLLSKASKIPISALVLGESEALNRSMRKSFFTLLAFEEGTPGSLDIKSFEQLGEDLAKIATSLGETLRWEAEEDVLARAQEQCFGLLDRLAGHTYRHEA